MDDDSLNVSTFARAFRKHFDIRTADSAAAALRALEQDAVDVVLSDYAMPGMSGIDLLRQVRSAYPCIVRLLISGHCELAALQNAKQQGITADVLPKPWENDELVTTIMRLLAGSGVQESAEPAGE